MNIQRLTISMPDYLYQRLVSYVQPRKISSFISQILEKEILTLKEKEDPIDEFLSFIKKNKIPKLTRKDVLKAIRKGRL